MLRVRFCKACAWDPKALLVWVQEAALHDEQQRILCAAGALLRHGLTLPGLLPPLPPCAVLGSQPGGPPRLHEHRPTADVS